MVIIGKLGKREREREKRHKNPQCYAIHKKSHAVSVPRGLSCTATVMQTDFHRRGLALLFHFIIIL
jgi:hypothetical protein